MRKQHHIIYVPGILDDYRHQSWAVKAWRLHGVHGHTHVMPWAGHGAFEPKLQRLLQRIDELYESGHLVSLVGASAGASAVLHAYDRRKDKVHGVVCFVAKLHDPKAVSPKIYARNPAFKESLETLPTVLQKLTPADTAKMHSFYSPKDGSVTYEDTLIPDVEESRLPSLRHGQAIAYALTLGASRLLAPLKRLAE
jgi:pimeloyl-ACP methyl ester carboxylesterase